jgi:hypothetical protein
VSHSYFLSPTLQEFGIFNLAKFKKKRPANYFFHRVLFRHEAGRRGACKHLWKEDQEQQNTCPVERKPHLASLKALFRFV